MERLVMCQICESNISKYGCKMCGKNVCSACFDPSRGVCLICAKGKHA